jgi:hypothetical protein
MIVSMLHQQLLLHYAAKMNEGMFSEITNILVTAELVLWRYVNAFYLTTSRRLILE